MMRTEILKLTRRAAAFVGLTLVALAVVALRPSGGLTQGDATRKELLALVETERAFSRASTERGMKDAFIEFAADDGLLFRRTVVNAKELWRQTNPPPTGLLTWGPSFADISRAGDLGYTTGPWEFRAKPTDAAAAGHGHFVTVWRRQADGTFKFALDIGIGHAAPASPSNGVQYPPPGRAGKSSEEVNAEGARRELLGAESDFTKAAASKGLAEAFISSADAEVRLYRQNAFPTVGREAVRATAEAKSGATKWQLTDAGVSRSGDLGYAYGSYEYRQKAADEKPSEQGHYVRIWKRAPGQRWRIVLDITNPVRPQ
jgi:ketosteroid isomerase-like protein